METTTVTTSEMSLLKALADANVEASKIRGTKQKKEVVVIKEIVEEKPAAKSTKPQIEFSEIEAKKMEALKALASVNLDVSKAKEAFQEFKKIETQYISERENKVLDRINVVINENQSILAETLKNYKFIEDLSKEAKECMKFLNEAYAEFEHLVETFEDKTKAWEINVSNIEKQHETIKNQIKLERTQIKNDQQTIERAKVLLKNDQRKLKDERETLERAIKRLKNNKI